jgi:hypothetical protein
MIRPQAECRLCGYQVTDYILFTLSLASPRRAVPVCRDCVEAIVDLLEDLPAEEEEDGEV